jgi:hypothetical protein
MTDAQLAERWESVWGNNLTAGDVGAKRGLWQAGQTVGKDRNKESEATRTHDVVL